MLEKYLQEIGLGDKEAAVYAALLQVDDDSVLDLSKKTKINRTTIYPVLESLAKKGLISEVKVNAKVRYQAEPPERREILHPPDPYVAAEGNPRALHHLPEIFASCRKFFPR